VRVLESGAGWKQQFVHMRSGLAKELERIAGVRFNGIHFE
jgi:hypothetical protein